MQSLRAPQPDEGREAPQPAASLRVSGILLRVLDDVLPQYGVCTDTIAPGGPPGALREPAEVRVPLAEFARRVRRATAATGDPALGLRCGLHASQSAFDLMAPLVAHVPSLRDAIHVSRRFQALAVDGVRVRLTDGGGLAKLRCDFPRLDEVSDRWFAEFILAGLLRMLQAFGGTRADLHAAHFEHAPPTRSHAYDAAFGSVVRFSRKSTELHFAASLLDRPNPHASPALQGLVLGQAEQHLARLGRPRSFPERLRLYLTSHCRDGAPDMETTARDLGLSVRSMRRRLRDADISYRKLAQELQCERARALLRDPELTLQEVSDALGFGEVSTFHRAFRRWTGETATEYRRSLR